MNSGTVRGLAFNCHQLISPAQECKDKMTTAIAGLPSYWVDLGGEEFKNHCMDWITKMEAFKQAISSLETDMLKYADTLQAEEKAAADRAKAAADQARAAAVKMTGKIK